MPMFSMYKATKQSSGRSVPNYHKSLKVEKPCKAKVVPSPGPAIHQHGALKDKPTGAYLFEYLTLYKHNEAAKLSLAHLIDGNEIKWIPDKQAYIVKIQPTVKHGRGCFEAIQSYLPEGFELEIHPSLYEAPTPQIDWIHFDNEPIFGTTNGSTKTVSIVTGIFVTGQTYPVRRVLSDH